MAETVGGLFVKNRVWVGSSELSMTLEGIRACIDAGAGAVIAKSVNESQAARDQLDIADYVFVDPSHKEVVGRPPTAADSLFNRSGLAQSSLDDWLEMLDQAQSYAAARGSAVIASITVADAAESARITGRLAEVVPAIEVNVGAPHGRESEGSVRQLTEAEAVAHMMATVRAATDKPIFLKLPSTASDVQALALAGQSRGADAVVFAGRYNGFIPDIETQRPLLGSWGAYGGSWALPMSLYAISKGFRSELLTLPIIGTNGARTADDVIRFLLSGASAIEIVTAVWTRGPGVITEILEGVSSYLAAHHVSDVEEMVGRSVHFAREYADIEPSPNRPEPWRQGAFPLPSNRRDGRA